MPSDLRVRSAPTADLSPADLAQLRRLLDGAFPGRFSDEDWGHALGGVHVLADVAGELVGHAAVVGRQLVAGDLTLRTGYVEAVATAAPWRRQGVGSAVLAEVERLVDGGFELGALSASQDGVALYTARGWTPWPGPTGALTPAGVVPTEGEVVHVRRTPATPAELDAGARLLADWRRGDLW